MTLLGPKVIPRGRLLVVDDDDQLRSLVSRLLRLNGHSVSEASSAEEAAAAVAEMSPDLILLDIELPEKSGLTFLEEIRSDRRLRLIPVVMMTGAATSARKLRAIEAGATDFLPKPFSHVELVARVRSLLDLKFTTDALEDAERMLASMAEAIDARDPFTRGHSARVSLYARLLGERIGLEPAELEAIRSGGLFHDIGKVAVRDAVLLKPDKLTTNEHEEMRQHPRLGRDLLSTMKAMAPVLDVVLYHHERIDGSGYPEGLTGERIPINARVTTIADVFDALKTARIYRGKLSRGEALTIMAGEAANGWWDRRLLEEFRGILEELPEDDPRLAALEGGSPAA